MKAVLLVNVAGVGGYLKLYTRIRTDLATELPLVRAAVRWADRRK